MKGLDTPVLLEILHGSPASKGLLKSLRGEELATSELNVFELNLLAARGGKTSRAARIRSLTNLRRRISVIPVGPGAVEAASRLAGGRLPGSGYAALVWGTMIAAGCQEWITTKAYAPARGLPGMRVRIV